MQPHIITSCHHIISPDIMVRFNKDSNTEGSNKILFLESFYLVLLYRQTSVPSRSLQGWAGCPEDAPVQNKSLSSTGCPGAGKMLSLKAPLQMGTLQALVGVNKVLEDDINFSLNCFSQSKPFPFFLFIVCLLALFRFNLNSTAVPNTGIGINLSNTGMEINYTLKKTNVLNGFSGSI